jgi:sporulation protein YlmC with PRC-barrel domain
MILSDILGSPVETADGEFLGRVADARFVVDVPGGQLLSGARLQGILVSPHNAGSFMGYERSSVNRPWPIAQLLRWWHRDSFLVLWEDIEAMGPQRVRLREGFTSYEPGLPETGPD